MSFSTYRFTLDLQKHQSQMSIATFQYDTAVKLSIGLTDGGVPYYLEDGCIAVLWGKKANGEPISHKCSIESNTKIIYEFNKETADEIGVVDCQIRLYKDGEEIISAPKFIIVVAERVVNDAEVFDAGDGAFEEQFSALDDLFIQESGRRIAENARVEAEKERQGNELLRKEEELSRIEFETQRQTDEAKRVNAEGERVKAETERNEAEIARDEAEKKRQEQYDYLLGENNKLEEYKQQSKEYADGIKNDLLNGAGPAYDTLKELGDALEENKDIIDTLASKKFLQDTLVEYDMTVVQKIASASDSLVPVTTEANKVYGTDANGNQKEYPLAIKYTDTGIVQRVGGGYISQPNPTQNWHGSTKEYTDKKDNEVKAYADSRINPLEERVTDLENLTLTFTEDTSTAYEKAVPAEVGKYALVKAIGGATRKVSATKNILDPMDMNGFYTTDNDYPITYKYNNDGTITYTIGWDGFCFFGLHNFPVGRYYLYLENASVMSDYSGNIELAFDSDYNPETNPDFTTCTKTLKVMVWQDTSVTTEDYEIVEAPEGTVFEPYIPTFQNAEVERIESIGANLFDGSRVNVTTIHGVSVQYDKETQIFTFNGTAQYNTSYFPTWLNLKGQKGKNYLVKTETLGGAVNNNGKNAVAYFGSGDTPNVSNNWSPGSLQNPTSRIMTLNHEYITQFWFYIETGVVFDNLQVRVMLARVDKNVPYEPYSAEPIDSIAIPFEAIKAKIDGFGKMVNDTYYDYIEFVDDKVFGYKVADEIVLNGTETWRNNGDVTSKNNYYLTIVTSDKTKYVSGQISSDRYDYFDLTSNNTEVGIDCYVSSAFGGFAVGVRPIDVTSLTVASFTAHVRANPITVRLALATPEVTDITDLFTEGNKLQVQQGGAIRFVNEQKMPVPNTVAFIKRKE